MRTILAIVLALAAANPAAAQRVPIPDKDSDFKPGKKEGAKDTRRVVQAFASCMVKRGMSSVADYLDRPVGPFTSALRSRAPACLIDSYDDDGDVAMLKGEALTYHYALAEAWLVRKYGDAGLGDIAAIAPLNHPDEVGFPHGLGPLSECIIRKASSESWALLRTDAASGEEKASFAALGPAMEACVSRGTTVKMQPFFMRGAIADSYYRLSKATRVGEAAE